MEAVFFRLLTFYLTANKEEKKLYFDPANPEPNPTPVVENGNIPIGFRRSFTGPLNSVVSRSDKYINHHPEALK